MKRSSRSIKALAAMLAMGALAGCSSGPSPEVREAAGMVLLVATRSDTAMDAGIDGSLAVTPGECIGVAGPDGTVQLAIWPEGSDLTGAESQIRTSGGITLSVGDPVRGSGGAVDLPSTDYPDVPARCHPGSSIMVISSVESG
jgi:hypothetical protein